MIRKAYTKDIDRIAEIYSAIHDAEEAGRLTIGWERGTYPVRKTAEDSVARSDMFVAEADGKVAAAAIINHIQVPEYRDCPWQYEASDEEVMVLHTLVVDPRSQAKGLGTAFIKFYEEYAKEHLCSCLRIDTQEKNVTARTFYKKLGFTEPGIVFCNFCGIPNVRLVCLEKKL